MDCEIRIVRPLDLLQDHGHGHGLPSHLSALWRHCLHFADSASPRPCLSWTQAVPHGAAPGQHGERHRRWRKHIPLWTISASCWAPSHPTAPAEIAPGFVRRAEDYMASHAAEPLTVAMIASHTGVSVRSLYAGFQRYRGARPWNISAVCGWSMCVRRCCHRQRQTSRSRKWPCAGALATWASSQPIRGDLGFRAVSPAFV